MSSTRVDDGNEENRSFLNWVSRELGPRRSREFFSLLTDFKYNRIDVETVASEASVLLKNNKELVESFNTFLPEEYQISLSQSAIDFINKLRQELPPESYNSILQILKSFKKGKKSSDDIAKEVAILLVDKPDLLQEFNSWLPVTENDAFPSTTTNPSLPGRS